MNDGVPERQQHQKRPSTSGSSASTRFRDNPLQAELSVNDRAVGLYTSEMDEPLTQGPSTRGGIRLR